MPISFTPLNPESKRAFGQVYLLIWNLLELIWYCAPMPRQGSSM